LLKSDFSNEKVNKQEENWDENPNDNIIYRLKLSDESINIVENENSLKSFLDEITNLNVKLVFLNFMFSIVLILLLQE
jgi:hypothetical protein